jgi:O-antigen/teichoic acid export membrane protein
MIALFSKDALALWLRDETTAARAAGVLSILVVGTAMYSIYHIPYALQLAHGRPRIPFATNVGLLLLALPTVAWLASHYGAMGGALSWALLGLVALFIGTIVTGRKVAAFAGGSWLARDVAVPFVFALVPALAGAWVSRASALPPWPETAVATLAACVGIAAGTLYSPFARRQLLAFIGGHGRQCPN